MELTILWLSAQNAISRGRESKIQNFCTGFENVDPDEINGIVTTVVMKTMSSMLKMLCVISFQFVV